MPFKQCERMPLVEGENEARVERQVVRAAIAAVRPRWTGVVPKKTRRQSAAAWKASCPMAYVVTGRGAGNSGRVFWQGVDKKTGETTRLGLETDRNVTIWTTVWDCANEPTWQLYIAPEEKALLERIAADSVMADRPELAREILASTRQSTALCRHGVAASTCGRCEAGGQP